MKPMIWGMALSVLAAGSANAALLGRVPATPGGTDYQAYYDTVLDITWVADANLAKTWKFDSDGSMGWYNAQIWIGILNTASYLGVNNWRLPKVVDIGTPGCDTPYAYSGTDCGWNADLSTGEMAHLFYDTLGNLAPYDTSGARRPPGYQGLTNTGPFSNIDLIYYWSGTTYAPGPGSAWIFRFQDGMQFEFQKGYSFYAWPVSPGDALVPVPAVAWLVAGAFAGIGAAAKRRAGTGTA